jgi:hypothetical protein
MEITAQPLPLANHQKLKTWWNAKATGSFLDGGSLKKSWNKPGDLFCRQAPSTDFPSYDGSNEKTYRKEASQYHNVNTVVEESCALIYEKLKNVITKCKIAIC